MSILGRPVEAKRDGGVPHAGSYQHSGNVQRQTNSNPDRRIYPTWNQRLTMVGETVQFELKLLARFELMISRISASEEGLKGHNEARK